MPVFNCDVTRFQQFKAFSWKGVAGRLVICYPAMGKRKTEQMAESQEGCTLSSVHAILLNASKIMQKRYLSCSPAYNYSRECKKGFFMLLM